MADCLVSFNYAGKKRLHALLVVSCKTTLCIAGKGRMG